MKTSKIELRLTEEVSPIPANEMNNRQLTNWFAFANALKFINIGQSRFDTDISEGNISYSALVNYTKTVSGDIAQCLKQYRGIPMKYSLDLNEEDALNYEEITYITD